jgi:predicted benzoate:H+ symporter BenE
MWRLLSWIGKIVATAWGGPGLVVLGDPGLDPALADAAGPRWVTRIATFAPLVILVLILIGLPWPIVAVVAAILLLPLVLNLIQATRHR